MTPYLLHETWIDLDHVLAISNVNFSVQSPAMMQPQTFGSATASVRFMFCNDWVGIAVAPSDMVPWTAASDYTYPHTELARKNHADLLTAWKARSK